MYSGTGHGSHHQSSRCTLRSQRSHLDDVDLRRGAVFGGNVQVVDIVSGDDEDDRGGTEGHPLLGAVSTPTHNDWPDGPFN